MGRRVRNAAAAVALAGLPPIAAGQDEPLSARAAVQTQQVYVGQQFLLQIQVRGADQPDPIDIGPLEADFDVTEAGGGSSNSTSVSIVNGRMTRQVQRGYNFNYRLAARRPGRLQVPSLTVSADGRTARTQPVPLSVQPPEENDDFKLSLSLSSARAYVGQAVTLAVEWYIGREVQNFAFTVPLLDDPRFELRDLPADTALRGQGLQDVLEIPLGDRSAIARRARAELDGREYTVLRFRKLLVPRSPGAAALPAATVTFETPRPGQRRPRSLFDDFFGSGAFSGAFGGRTVMQTLAIPSNRPRLDVLDLPAAGRPAGFNGWIGEIQVEAEAKPTSVAVGQPVTLSLRVRGPGVQLASTLPPLDRQPDLVRDFQVPNEIGAAEGEGDERRFTQTLRAKHAGVTEIPPIELPYFSPSAGAYRIARSEPIPLEVEAARIVTAEDAEGRGGEPRQFEVESGETGIGHNYRDASALEPMDGGIGPWVRPLGSTAAAAVLLALPPLAYFGLLAVRKRREFGTAPRRRARGAHGRWSKAIGAVDSGSAEGPAVAALVLAAMREYLGVRSAGTEAVAAAWTSGDVESEFVAHVERRRKGAPPDLAEPLAALRTVFERCEAATFAGGVPLDAAWKSQLVADAREAVARLEDRLR